MAVLRAVLIVGGLIRGRRAVPRMRLAVLVAAALLAPAITAGSARAATSCSEIPTVYGIPPWGFHTGPYTGASSFAKGHGNINLQANTVSGVICQQDRAGVILMAVEHHLVYHSHHAVMWGYPGNVMKIVVRVRSSTDRRCKVGTVGQATLYASYNGVRSDSVQFFFPAACSDQDHLYHGSQVNNQVPPLWQSGFVSRVAAAVLDPPHTGLRALPEALAKLLRREVGKLALKMAD